MASVSSIFHPFFVSEMTNASLQDLKRLCDALVQNPATFAAELEKMGFNITLLEQRCSEITQDLLQSVPAADINSTSILAAPSYDDDEYWPMDIRIIMTLIFSLLSIIGILGNILVVLVVFKVPGMRTPTNCYLVSLAVSDCLFFLATSPTELSYLHVTSTTYIFGSFGCALFTYVPYLSINTSSLSITAFTIERFIWICYPLRARYAIFHVDQNPGPLQGGLLDAEKVTGSVRESGFFE